MGSSQAYLKANAERSNLRDQGGRCNHSVKKFSGRSPHGLLGRQLLRYRVAVYFLLLKFHRDPFTAILNPVGRCLFPALRE
eukprot:scaffold56546_cov42-Prasinocladus_malaysianus.AAC.1